ncbi:hypothetical protein IM311_21145 [Enterobacter cloacae complex sp. P40RS]|uniref:Uncharacterized protein n=1 Tax=Enterobacter pasteurii TaxID=3029761 RepID=A0ABR9QCN9_9ENTR|nr:MULTISPECIES: hypothetical protein [Enterobacter cloacae complex]MBE4856577.1 hypothetical protein [Enterobacter pasteurii]MBE4863986.1 hypothetical protein [Enterobacter cloacae complex sp. P40C2]MBE4876300.1 hypothetical protein [Enterobacter cloacae complex sp. P40C]
MMFLPRLYARLCARQAGRTLLANRIAQNYSQFMRRPEADVPADFLHQNAHELSGFNFVEQIFPPALWRRNVRFDLHAYVAQWTQAQAFYSSPRTLLLGMRWAGFGLIVDALLATAPEDVRFQFITRHPALHKLMAAHEERRAGSFFAPHRLVTVLLMDERLPDAPLFMTQAGDQKAGLTDVSTRFLSRYGYRIRTLLPVCSLHSAEFALESQAYAPEDYRQAATDTLNALRKTPTLWSAWDDLSVIYHG